MLQAAKGEITHQQLHERVLERLRTAILNGELRPGEFIRQQRVAEQYGVSQMPVREALRELAAEGLVENIPYRGVRVVQYAVADIEDLFALRSFMEGRTATAAADRISQLDLERLKVLVSEIHSAVASDRFADYRSLNRQFHQVVYRASQSQYLIQVLDKLWTSYPAMLPGNFPQARLDSIPNSDERDISEHQAIVAALERRDGEAAGRIMSEHIQHAGRELVNTLREHGSVSAQPSDPS